MKSISDIFWHLSLNDSSTILLKHMKNLHNEERKIPKPTPQEKEIENVFKIAEDHNPKVFSGFIAYAANPTYLDYISNNLHFLISRYNGSKKQEYSHYLKNFDEKIIGYKQPIMIGLISTLTDSNFKS